MEYIDLTLPAPEQNLACDETLLDLCEREPGREVLRFWEPDRPFVVVGYSNRVAVEVKLESCRQLGIPVLRRITGGGAVLQGPGCLNYTLVLTIGRDPMLESITHTNAFVLERHRAVLCGLLNRTADRNGATDLTLDGRKFSGNSQRRRRECLLFHGTFLFDFDAALMEAVLAYPSRVPDYRQARRHGDFLVRLPLSKERVRDALRDVWEAREPALPPAEETIQHLVRTRYGLPAWNADRAHA